MMWNHRMRLGVAILGTVLLASSLAFSEGSTGADPAPGPDPTAEPSVPPSQAKTIFDYKDKLALTDQQMTDIRKLLYDLQRGLRIAQARLILLGYDLEDLIKADGDLKAIQEKIQESERLRSEARFADISASRNINKVLSESQLAAWRAIQEEARKKPNR